MPAPRWCAPSRRATAPAPPSPSPRRQRGDTLIIRLRRDGVWTLGLLAVLGALWHPAPASAQLSGSASLSSDERFRGYSLSGQRPVAAISLYYDDASGAYFGASAAGVATKYSGFRFLSVQDNAGYAGRLESGEVIDLGITRSEFGRSFPGGYPANYTELYLGLIGKRLSTHVYYSPHYFQSGVSTLYVEVDGIAQPARHWRLIAHGGMLTRIADTRQRPGRSTGFDWRLGIARQFGPFEAQLSWIGRLPKPKAAIPGQDQTRLVAGLTYAF